MAFRSALCMLAVAPAAADEFLQPRRASDCSAEAFCCWWPQNLGAAQCGQCGTEWGNRKYLPGTSCPSSDGRPFETGEKYQCQGSGTWCEGGPPILAKPQLQGQLEDCDVCSQDGYTGYNHRDSGSPEGQHMVTVGGYNGQWSLCAEQCSEDASCQGWTYVYDGTPGASSFQCWLKSHLESTDYTQWTSSGDDISGLRKAEPQLQGQLEDCDVCSQDGYTGYNHRDSGSPEGQHMVTVSGYNGQWSLCAEQCSEDVSCQGWTYVYDGTPGASSFQCWLKSHLESTDYTQWKSSGDDISGLRK